MPEDIQTFHEAPPPSTGRGHKRPVFCQVRDCSVNLALLGRQYFVRKKICSQHLTAVSVLLDPVEHGEEPFRFCQQCGKLEPLSEFEGAKRSCRLALQRRRQSKQQAQNRSRKRSSSDSASDVSEIEDHHPEPRNTRTRIVYSKANLENSRLNASGFACGDQYLQSQQALGQASPWCGWGRYAFAPGAAATAFGPQAAGVALPAQQQQQQLQLLANQRHPESSSVGLDCEGFASCHATGVTTDLINTQFGGAGFDVEIPDWPDVTIAAQTQQIEARQQNNNFSSLPPPDQSDTGDLVWDEMLKTVCDSFPATDDGIDELLASEVTAATAERRAGEPQQQQQAATVLPQGGSCPGAAGPNPFSLSPKSVTSRADVVCSDPNLQHLLHTVNLQQYQLQQQQQQLLQLQQLLPTQSDLRGPSPAADAALPSPTEAATAVAGGQIAITSGFGTPQGLASAWVPVPACTAVSTATPQQMLSLSNSLPTYIANNSVTSSAAVTCQDTPVTSAAAISNLVQLEGTLGILSRQLAQFQSGVQQSVVQLLGTNAQGQQQMMFPVEAAGDMLQHTAVAGAVPGGSEQQQQQQGAVQHVMPQAMCLLPPLQPTAMLE